ncbi:MAG: SDR family oxidoreductase [Antricoccus sp.]
MSGLFDLTGKKAVVTGGGTGIGLGMAEALADCGASVEIWGRRQHKLDEAAAKNPARGLTTRSVDVADEAAVQEGFEASVKDNGGLDIVIINAGVGNGHIPLLEVTADQFHEVTKINLDGAFWTLREAAKHMVAAKNGGSIIAISSLAAVDATPNNYAYGASKSGVVGMVKAAAVELARHQIRVNAVLPGWIATDMTEGAQGSELFNEKVIKRVPIRRWGQPADFAGMAVYLASDASSYQTGTSTLIDGGYSIF